MLSEVKDGFTQQFSMCNPMNLSLENLLISPASQYPNLEYGIPHSLALANPKSFNYTLVILPIGICLLVPIGKK